MVFPDHIEGISKLCTEIPMSSKSAFCLNSCFPPSSILKSHRKMRIFNYHFYRFQALQGCSSDLLLETFSWQFLLSTCDCISVSIIFSNIHQLDFGLYLPNSYIAYWKLPEVEIWLLKWLFISIHFNILINSSKKSLREWIYSKNKHN